MTDEHYIHCKSCYSEKPKDQCMKEYARLSIIKRNSVLTVWCERHDDLVCNLPLKEDDLTCSCQKCQKKEKKVKK